MALPRPIEKIRVFSHYRDKLTEAGVPNESALYSCLREAASAVLGFPEYPWVLRKDQHNWRLPLPVLLERYVLDEDGVVTGKQLRDFIVDTLLVNEKLVAVYVHSIPGLLRLGRSKYVHVSQLGIEVNDLAPVVQHLDHLLQDADHLSANKLFGEKRVTCKLLGISTPSLLYSLLQIFFAERYGLLRYPSIYRQGTSRRDRRKAGITEEVTKYIRNKQVPCSAAELAKHFVDDLGYDLRNVYSVLVRGQDIVRYSEGTFVHVEMLGWDQTCQTALECLAHAHLAEREEAGKPYGLVRLLYEYGHLPPLPDYASWTPTVLGELLHRGGRFRLLGPPRNAFVSIPNSMDIETLADLLCTVLTDEYDSVARLDVFIKDMVSAGVLQKNLTQMMLGEDSKVVIKGTVVMTKEAMELC